VAACFCGCGQRVGLRGRSANRRGRETVELTGALRRERDYAIEEGPLTEWGADPDEWRAGIAGLGDRIELGEQYVHYWAGRVHGDEPESAVEGEWKEMGPIARDLEAARTTEDRLYDE
jgi:hypothetical protein